MASSVATPLERQFGHIAGVTEMTSSSTLGTTSVTLQFDLSRDINGAARDVEAGINAARTYLPANLPANPTYRKVNPADSPILVLGLQSDIYDVPQLYDEASTVIEQRISQISGVGEVLVVGASLPAVRIELNPDQLASYGISLPAVQQVDRRAEFESRQRPVRQRRRDRGHHRQRPDLESRRLQAAGGRLSQRRRGSPAAMSRTWSIRSRPCGRPASSTASRR